MLTDLNHAGKSLTQILFYDKLIFNRLRLQLDKESIKSFREGEKGMEGIAEIQLVRDLVTKVTQEELAQRLGKHPMVISRWVRGKRKRVGLAQDRENLKMLHKEIFGESPPQVQPQPEHGKPRQMPIAGLFDNESWQVATLSGKLRELRDLLACFVVHSRKEARVALRRELDPELEKITKLFHCILSEAARENILRELKLIGRE